MFSPLSLKIKLNRMHPCALGYGRRFGIWMQGCDLACAGCCSRDTWNIGSDHEIGWPFFAATLDFALSGRPFDGVTISGGEPFQQREALVALLREIRSLQARLDTNWDILLYTGYSFESISADTEALSGIDLLIAGPYDARSSKAALRGSSNQTLHRLTNRASDRYTDSWLAGPGLSAHMDVALAGNDMLITGLPAKGDMRRFERALAARGVTAESRSWRAERNILGGIPDAK